MINSNRVFQFSKITKIKKQTQEKHNMLRLIFLRIQLTSVFFQFKESLIQLFKNQSTLTLLTKSNYLFMKKWVLIQSYTQRVKITIKCVRLNQIVIVFYYIAQAQMLKLIIFHFIDLIKLLDIQLMLQTINLQQFKFNMQKKKHIIIQLTLFQKKLAIQFKK
ncbi:transmembrane protein, putative (macronuclear) [Tetrahymena thermophila SB210]|uniref:Transmembrane protein, putative n=1 Tax=Tetrahymena thermophila (strain SB210) TaxID=312017 RepID=W7XCV6_TETTS|nr:transmembrane protein, putative [Tetrahymena thermophila SB210]EWS74408.1 transmembrane protein, putative [Tetrahymena thermophila SB210]|eukprot:XP_012653085.1 transmembrane protein, putative [Tetrahymena thermophila SB210]